MNRGTNHIGCGLPSRAPAGFTMVELLVVMALLAVLLVMTSIFGNRSVALIGDVSSRVATDRIATAAFEQIARDLEGQVIRREVTMRVVKKAGNGDDELVLITRRFGLPTRADEADRRVSTVHYRVTDHILRQGSDGYRFGDSSSRPSEEEGLLDLHGLPELGPDDLDDDSFRTLAAGVLRLEIGFVVRKTDGSTRIEAAEPVAPDRAEALIVSLVVLDPERTRMIDGGQRARIAAEFADAVPGKLVADQWMDTARELAGKSDSLSVPGVALRQVRVYQRRIQLAAAASSL